MSRVARAAMTLRKQVEDEKSKAKVETYGDVDGLGVYRTLKFDKTTSKWLEPLLGEIEDARIEEYHLTEDGFLHVTFVAGPTADHRDAFPLEAAAEVLKG